MIFRFLAPAVAVLTGLTAVFAYKSLKRAPQGTEVMSGISEQIRVGAMTYLKTQYMILLLFVIGVAIILYFGVSPGTSLAFVFGAGFLGSSSGIPASIFPTRSAPMSALFV